MEFRAYEHNRQRILEALPGQPGLRSAHDVNTILEACFEHSAYRVILSHEQLSERFFDLSSGEAGIILQKLRTYRVRLAIMQTPALTMSSRFAELLADEAHGSDLRLVPDQAAALLWLSQESEGMHVAQ